MPASNDARIRDGVVRLSSALFEETDVSKLSGRKGDSSGIMVKMLCGLLAVRAKQLGPAQRHWSHRVFKLQRLGLEVGPIDRLDIYH
jgi:hypothetical protein